MLEIYLTIQLLLLSSFITTEDIFLVICIDYIRLYFFSKLLL